MMAEHGEHGIKNKLVKRWSATVADASYIQVALLCRRAHIIRNFHFTEIF